MYRFRVIREIAILVILGGLLQGCPAGIEETQKFVITGPSQTTKLFLDNSEESVVHIATRLFAEDVRDISGKEI